METLEKKEREAKQAAKQQAAKELALMLTAPEDLNKVEQIRSLSFVTQLGKSDERKTKAGAILERSPSLPFPFLSFSFTFCIHESERKGSQEGIKRKKG